MYRIYKWDKEVLVAIVIKLFLYLLSNTLSSVQFLMSWDRLLNSIAVKFCSVPGTVDGSRRRSQEDLRALAGYVRPVWDRLASSFGIKPCILS